MTADRRFVMSLVIAIELFATERGGRQGPIASGYRPLCIFSNPDGSQVTVGLGELEVPNGIEPGAIATGRLSFDDAVASVVRSRGMPGSTFLLAEGNRPIGSATVLSIEDPRDR